MPVSYTSSCMGTIQQSIAMPHLQHNNLHAVRKPFCLSSHLNLWSVSSVCTVVAPPKEWPITAAVLRSRRPRNCPKSNFRSIMFCTSTPSLSNPRTSSDLPTSNARCFTYSLPTHSLQKLLTLIQVSYIPNGTYLSISKGELIFSRRLLIELQPVVVQFSQSPSWLRDTSQ